METKRKKDTEGKEIRTDRRIRKTQAQLRAGLAKLMQTKSIQQITVKELVDEVDINRSTFYLHYADIYDMLQKTEDELLENILNLIGDHIPVSLEGDSFPFILDLFNSLSENLSMCKALMGPNGDITFINKIKDIITEQGLKVLTPMFPGSLKDLKYSYSFCLSGCVGLIQDWLLTDAKESPEHMAELTFLMVTNAVRTFYETAQRKEDLL